MLLSSPYSSYNPIMLQDLNWKIRRICFIITIFGTPFISEEELEEEKNANEVVLKQSSKLPHSLPLLPLPSIVDKNIVRRANFNGFNPNSVLLIDDRRRGDLSYSNPFSVTERYLNLHGENRQILTVSTLGRLSPVLRPTPYARMMSSTSHSSDRERDRERYIERERERERDRDWTSNRLSTCDSSPRMSLNLLHGLYKANTDLWRLVISFL